MCNNQEAQGLRHSANTRCTCIKYNMQWHDNNLIHDISQYGKLFFVYEFRSERMYNLSTYTTDDLDVTLA